jgi:hypothetical protein
VGDWAEDLERLADLREKGVITDEEWERQKQRLLPDSTASGLKVEPTVVAVFCGLVVAGVVIAIVLSTGVGSSEGGGSSGGSSGGWSNGTQTEELQEELREHMTPATVGTYEKIREALERRDAGLPPVLD